jgi:hypothetical protein
MLNSDCFIYRAKNETMVEAKMISPGKTFSMATTRRQALKGLTLGAGANC